MAQISSNKCDICTEEGTALCYECQHYLCGSCRAWHDKFPRTKLHNVVDSSQVNKVFSATKLLCKKHNRNFIHFCQKCSCLTCAICATSDHKAHPFTDVCEVSSQARTGVEEHIGKLKAKVKQLTELSDTIRSRHLKRAEEDKQKFTNAVNKISKEFSNIISLEEDIFITRATDNFVLRQQYFRYFLDKTGKLSDTYQLVCTKLEHALTETHEVAFYIQYKELNKEYEELDKIPQLGEAEVIGELKKEEFTASVVDKIQEKYDLSTVSLIKAKDKEIQKLTTKLNNEREKAKSLLESKDREIEKLLQDIKMYFKNSPVSLEKPENREIQVFVNIIMAGKRLVFVFHAHDKIRIVKQLIANKEGIPADQQILLLTGTGKQLRDESTIADYEINNGSSLDLRILRPHQILK